MKPTLVFQRRKVNAELDLIIRLEQDRNVDGLIALLGSDLRGPTRYSIIRSHAAAVLARLGDPRAIPHLVAMRDDPEEQVRFTVNLALGKLQARDAEGFLVDALHDSSRLVRMSAASALGRMGAVDAIPALREVLDSDRDAQVRASAVESLLILGDETARARVPEVMNALSWRARAPSWKRIQEAAESGEPLTPWVSRWE